MRKTRKITQVRLKGSVLKTESRGNPSGGSNPSSSAIIKNKRGVEQLVARRAHNPKAAGSSPAPATNGPIAKLVIAPPCHGGDHGFESRWGRHYIGRVAQSVEQQIEALRVGGSIPSTTTIKTKINNTLWVLFLFLNYFGN